MGIKKKIKNLINKLIRKFSYEVKTPVYIPVSEGNILSGKTVLITGGSAGIGYAIAGACLRNGADVIIAGRNPAKLAAAKEKLIAQTNSSDNAIVTLVLDVLEISNLKDKIKMAAQMASSGKIDVLVNNAGISAGAAVGATLESDFDKTLDTNLKGTYFMAQEFSNYLIENKIAGNILNISSASGVRPAITPYMLSKWGLTGLTEGLAKKCIKHSIVVNGIAPGPTATDMLRLDGENLMYEGSPAKRYADPIEVANLACFLISDMGRMIVGDTVYITGGCGTLTVDDIKY